MYRNIFILGTGLLLEKANQTAVATRRIGLIWAAFGKLNHILKNPRIPEGSLSLRDRAQTYVGAHALRYSWKVREAQVELCWLRCKTKWGKVDPQDVIWRPPSINAKPGETKEMDRRQTAVVEKNWVRPAQDQEAREEEEGIENSQLDYFVIWPPH